MSLFALRSSLSGLAVAFALGLGPVLQDQSPDLESQLAAIEQRGDEVKDLTARFAQDKHTALLREPMTSSGTVRVRAGRVLWETKEPRPSSMGIEQKRAIVLYPQQKAAEIYPLQGEMRLLGASPLPQIATLREAFEIAATDATDLLDEAPEGAIGLALSPRPGPMRDYIERVRALIDPEIPALIALEIIDVDGDRTVIRFTDIETNQGLTEDDVTLKLGAGIDVSYPAGLPDTAEGEGTGR